jgi:DNA-directed RNA polymerase specialized sigma subunit
MFSILFIIFIIHFSKLCHGYLNAIQIGYIKNILSNPTTPTDIRRKTQQILFMEYMPWLKKQVRLFKQSNVKSLKFILEYDLQQYAIIGFLDAIKNFDGNSSLINYAAKHVEGKLRLGILELMPLKPLNHYQKYIKRRKYMMPSMLSYDKYWLFDKCKRAIEDEKNIVIYGSQNNNTLVVKENEIITHIKMAVMEMPEQYKSLFFARYDMGNLRKIRSVYKICKMFRYSDETYRKRMNVIHTYLRWRLRKLVF